MTERKLTDLLTWFCGTVVGGFFALRMASAALVDSVYTPVGNDSFFHARRILDAAVGERGFYQFDTMIHVPEGSWLTWPWAFDYVCAKVVSVYLLLNPEAAPTTIAAHIAPFLLILTIALLVLIAREINLHPALTFIAVLAFAAFPPNQFTYGVGVFDHHSAEQIFCLLTIWLGLRYFRNSTQPRVPIALGLALGIAPAFHTGLFIMQLPVVACVFILWLRGSTPPSSRLIELAIALIIGTVIAVLPSATFWDFQFGYSTLSWFHLYASCCTAIALVLVARLNVSRNNIAILVLTVTALMTPLASMIINAADFLSGELLLLSDIAEVKSPLGLMTSAFGVFIATSNFSWLIVLAPVAMLVFLWRLFRETDPQSIFFVVSALFSLALLLTQVRLNVYGSWALFLGGAWLIEKAAQKNSFNLPAVAGLTAVLVIGAYYPAIKYQLFKVYPPGLDNEYSTSRGIYPHLASACNTNPGTTLAYNDDGHRVRYHTDCSVVANNFLLTPQHGEKILELQTLLRKSPEELVEDAPHIDYVFARLYNVMQPGPNGYVPTPKEYVIAANEPLMNALTMRDDLPPNYELITEISYSSDAEFPFARVFRINR